MIAIKFENGKVNGYLYPCRNLEENMFDRESFELFDWDGNEEDVPFLKRKGNEIAINQEEKDRFILDEENSRKKTALKVELENVKHDIEQVDLFGMVREDIDFKRARAAEIVNELRVLEGKEPREVKNE